MSKQKKKTAQSATEKEEQITSADPEPVKAVLQESGPLKPTETQLATANAEPETQKEQAISILDIIKGIPEDKAAMAEQVGIPLKMLLRYFYQQERQQKEIIGFLAQLGAKLQASPATPAETTANPTSSQSSGGLGGSLGPILQMIPQFLSNSQAENPLQTKAMELMSTLLDQAINRITSPNRFEAMLDEELMKSKVKVMAKAIEAGV